MQNKIYKETFGTLTLIINIMIEDKFMKEIIIQKNEAGQRFDKFLFKYLNNSNSSFIYKMIRKKNILLNGKKAVGNEKLNIGDSVKLFFSDDTLNKFHTNVKINRPMISEKHSKISKKDIVYEDENILIINKKAGILSQKAVDTDYSINEMAIDYLMESGVVTEETLETFKPSICNRLDRNTTGLIIIGKTLLGSQVMAELLRYRSVHKYYLTIVKGEIKQSSKIDGYLLKDEKHNKVIIGEKGDRIITEYSPLKCFDGMTLLKVHLITGKTHQIRAHLASIGHPLAGDTKYGDKRFNKKISEIYKNNHQMLHAYMLVFEELEGKLDNLSNKVIKLNPPKDWHVDEYLD